MKVLPMPDKRHLPYETSGQYFSHFDNETIGHNDSLPMHDTTVGADIFFIFNG